MGKNKNTIRQGIKQCYPNTNKTTKGTKAQQNTGQQEHIKCGTLAENKSKKLQSGKGRNVKRNYSA